MALITKEEKKAVIKHYDKMIAWVEKQDLSSKVSATKMNEQIGEWWHSGDCPLCRLFLRQECHDCPIANTNQYCNQQSSFWAKMDSSKTWEEWLFNAERLRAYVAKLPEVY